jgi:hypothetical protein
MPAFNGLRRRRPVKHAIQLGPATQQAVGISAETEHHASKAGIGLPRRPERRRPCRGAHEVERRSGKFTPSGAKQDALQFALNELVPSLHKARTTIQKARAEVSERKSKLTLQGPDKTDVAAAIRRQEIRQFLRDMKPEQQSKFFGSQEGRLPPEILAAVLEMPPEFSGVPNTRHAMLMDQAIEAQHGPEAAEIAQLEEAITVAESTVETGRDEMRLEVGAHDKREFERQAAEIEAQYRPVWLRKKGDQTVVVDLDRRVERDATAADLETGAFYENYDQYASGRVA